MFSFFWKTSKKIKTETIYRSGYQIAAFELFSHQKPKIYQHINHITTKLNLSKTNNQAQKEFQILK